MIEVLAVETNLQVEEKLQSKFSVQDDEKIARVIDRFDQIRAKCLIDRKFQKVHGDEIRKLQDLLKKISSQLDTKEAQNTDEKEEEKIKTEISTNKQEEIKEKEKAS